MTELYDMEYAALGVDEKSIAEELARRRLVFLKGKIDTEMSNGIRKVLAGMDFKESKPITLLIGSGGGDMTSAARIIGMIEMLRSPVDGLVIDHCGSAAIDVLFACRERRALPTADFFLHFVRTSFDCVIDSDEVTANDLAGLAKRMTDGKSEREGYYARRMKKSRESVHSLLVIGEKYSITYSSREALELGIIDKIETGFKLLEPRI